jgi:hypothetical protein
MTKTQVLKLRPEFSVCGGMRMVDWFEVTEGEMFFCIHSGLRHADGETKSPYHYDDCAVGKNSKKQCLVKFSEWWNNINK